MHNFDEFKKCCENFDSEWRPVKHPALTPPKLRSLDDIWKKDDYWPNRDRAGVYAIFDADERLLYIGKASFNSKLGIRLAYHFRSSGDGGWETRPGDKWTRRPFYVSTIPVEKSWLAPAIEEFMIAELEPTDNSVGRKH